jgi:fructokinase
MHLYGGIEAGGTKFVCVTGSGPDHILSEVRFPTTSPDETISKAIEFFRASPSPIEALGVATFGPVDLNPASPTYGQITSTPKPGWSQVDILNPFKAALDVPVGLDTDVNGAALGEHRWGAGRGMDPFIYITIGTGIGGGGIINGRPMHGLIHPEMGHILLPHDREADPFLGVCPYHGDCFEGLASGPAMKQRWGEPAENLPPDHPAWELEASYIAAALASLTCAFSPERFVLGGGVLQNQALFPAIRSQTISYLNGYIQSDKITGGAHEYIIAPELGSRSGSLGAIALAISTAEAR